MDKHEAIQINGIGIDGSRHFIDNSMRNHHTNYEKLRKMPLIQQLKTYLDTNQNKYKVYI